MTNKQKSIKKEQERLYQQIRQKQILFEQLNKRFGIIRQGDYPSVKTREKHGIDRGDCC